MADRNIDGKIQVPFTKASTLSNLDGTGNGENIVTAFSKLAKWYDSLTSKISAGDVFGTNATLLDNTKNIDTTTTQGVYFWTQSSKPTNLPKRKLISTESTLTQGLLFVFRPTNYSSIVQIIVPINVYTSDGWSIYIRTSTSTSLSSVDWHLIESTAEFDTYPVENSANGITSGAMWTIINGLGDASLADITDTVTSSSGDLPTSDAVYTAISNAINTLDVPASGTGAITGFGAGKTLASLTETDGIVDATFQDIDIVRSQVSDLFGVGTLLTSSNNLNSLSDGVYYYTGTSVPTNTPAGARSTLIQFSNTDASYSTQIVVPYAKTSMVFYVRRKSDDWGDWRTFECMANYDSTPTSGSVKAVQSGGIYTALSNKQDTITFDGTYDSSTNPVATVSSILSRVFDKGTSLDSTEDLNNYTAPTYEGTYYWGADSVPTNSPIKDYKTGADNAAVSGKLIVLGGAATTGGQHTVQIVFPIGNSSYGDRFYFRISTSSSAWGDWSAIIDTYTRVPTLIAVTDDLDYITNPGKYYGTSKIHAPKGVPTTSQGVSSYTLYVEKTNNQNGRLRQILKPYIGYSSTSTGGNCIFERVRTSSWQKWIKYEGTQVDYEQTSAGTSNIGDVPI